MKMSRDKNVIEIVNFFGYSIEDYNNNEKVILKELCEYRDYLTKNISKNINLVDQEIYKTWIRSNIRYSKLSVKLIKMFVKRISDSESKLKKFYTTLPYVLIHFPEDSLEVGTIHSDNYRFEEMYTCWTPINTNITQYSPISIFIKTNNYLTFISATLLLKLIKNTKLQKFLLNIFGKKEKELIAIPGKYYIWDGKTLHIGNLNTSNQIHTAMTYRITKNKNPYEPSVRIDRINDLNEIDFFNEKEFLNLLFQIHKKYQDSIIVLTNNISCIELINKISKEYKDLNEEIKKRLSFAFSLLGQRLDKIDKNYSLVLHCLSLAFGSENMNSKRVLDKNFK